MTHALALLDTLTRPRLLIKAARIGAAQYRRDIHLGRLLDIEPLPDSGAALELLIEIEAALDEARRRRSAEYAVARHLDLLIAIMGEARLIRAAMVPEGATPAQGMAPAPVS
ncbi:DUF6477 family protein [Roseovarius sp.]|uniref:DUF6477 family protein n=1 Tax=Roseovarius sp. TaxID=1486281 RepID=UPI003D0F851A